MYSLKYSENSLKQLEKLEKSIQQRILNVLERVTIRPEHYAEKLVGIPGYKLRVGDYRVIIDINRGELVILVIEIGHRKNIYD